MTAKGGVVATDGSAVMHGRSPPRQCGPESGCCCCGGFERRGAEHIDDKHWVHETLEGIEQGLDVLESEQ